MEDSALMKRWRDEDIEGGVVLHTQEIFPLFRAFAQGLEVPYTGDFSLVTLARHCREHADVLAYVAPSHVVILSRLRSRGCTGK